MREIEKRLGNKATTLYDVVVADVLLHLEGVDNAFDGAVQRLEPVRRFWELIGVIEIVHIK